MNSQRSCFAVLVTALSCFSLSNAAPSPKKPSSTIDDYLKGVGYLQIPLTRDAGNHLYTRCLLEGKSHRFIVDSCCGITAVNPALLKNCKKLDLLETKCEDETFSNLIMTNLVLLDA